MGLSLSTFVCALNLNKERTCVVCATSACEFDLDFNNENQEMFYMSCTYIH